jgi:hypothetical protein
MTVKIYGVNDPEFCAYGRVVTGMEETVQELLTELRETPLPEAVQYVPEESRLQALPAMAEVSEHLYGGMPVQLGWCNGHNTKLNCLEYHRDSEFNLGTEDFILLLGRQEEIVDGKLETDCIRAFLVPAGVLVEVYATTLHYAPCHTRAEQGFQVLVALPWGTNLEKPEFPERTQEDRLLWARNKWLLAHPDSEEASQGAYVGLVGKNIDIMEEASCEIIFQR